MGLVLWLCAAALVALGAEVAAEACAVCQSGVPVAGSAPASEKHGGSVGLSARIGGAAVSGTRVDERRFDLEGSYEHPSRFAVDIDVPLLWRHVTAATGTLETASFGDVETRIRFLAWRRHESHLFVFAGSKWPTAPVGLGPDGAPLPSALQPGCSAIAPLVGATMTWGWDDWQVRAIGEVLLPFSIRDAPHPGDTVRLATSLERRLSSWLSARASLSLRLETGGALREGVPDPSSGGAAAYVSTDLVVRPVDRLAISLGAHFPVVQAWFGARRETTVTGASVWVGF